MPMARNMSAHPAIILGENTSPAMVIANIVPNTVSSDRMTAACEAGAYLRDMFWSIKANAELNVIR